MEPRTIANKYRIVDTLFQNELQNVYMVEDIENNSADQYILNEILDSSIIYSLKEVFNEEIKFVLKSYLGYYYDDSNLCIVSSINSGIPMDNYLSSNNLRISDKMYLTENLLNQLLKLENTNRLFKHHLLDLENISVAPNRAIDFNLNIRFDKAGLYTTATGIVSKLGDVICCIFANTPQATLEGDKDNLPPAIASIVRKCKSESYSSIGLVNKDFKASLLYSTFIGSSSVDKLIMRNIQRAKRKRSLKPVKRLAAILLVAAVLAGGYYAWDDLARYLPAFRSSSKISTKQYQIPIASFSLSKNRVYEGDSIDFVSHCTNPSIDDKIISYEWSVSRNNDMYILFSREQNPSYLFEEDGDYIVSLIVKDAAGISSNAFKAAFKVYPKEEIPVTPGGSDNNSTDFK